MSNSLPVLLSKPPPDDFVSFPTLPDPETAGHRSFSTILSTTLRRVTNNASNLVHTYAPQRVPDLLDPRDFEPHSLPPETLREWTKPKGDASGEQLPQLQLPSTSQVPSVPLAAGRVTSDARTLRLLTIKAVPHPPTVVNATDISTNAPPTTETFDTVAKAEPEARAALLVPLSPPAAQLSLQNRILSIFNNLPNDIELSDDSASDTESVANDTSSLAKNTSIDEDGELTSLPNLKLILPLRPRKNASRSQRLPNAHNGLATMSASRLRTKSQLTAHSPSSSNFYTLKSLAPPMTRKISSNFSSAILGGAKSIINTNLAGMASSTTSMVSSIDKKRRKKKKPRKISDNPLKNGGMPKKYWMNDSFVSDCLNCFKPFTAFRRKHHCRFCGQIYCADCTLFISYTQYKAQRANTDVLSKNEGKSYDDKLRVCKPCYNDVVVYLSDESMSSSSDEQEVKDTEAILSDPSDIPVEISPPKDHPLVRYRTLSLTSRRNSTVGDLSSTPSSNRVFLASREPDVSSSTAQFHQPEPHQRSPEGYSHKQAPQMAIPTTRTGQAVEIPAKTSLAPSSGFQSNSNTLALKNASLANLISVPSVTSETEQNNASWYKSYQTYQNQRSSDSFKPRSLENLSLLYKSMVNSRYGRISINADNEYLNINHKLLPVSQQEQIGEAEEDFESENEDEQVMSLYTSLHHSSLSQSNLSPRPHNGLHPTSSSVPTLHEFPTMVADEKYLPSSYKKVDGIMQFDSNIISLHGVSLNEDRLRSDRRSNERAKASLRRIRGRRNHKLNKPKWLNLNIAPMNEPASISANESSSVTPLSPTPRSSLIALLNRLRDSSPFADFHASRDFNRSNPQLQPLGTEEFNHPKLFLGSMKHGDESQNYHNHSKTIIENLSTLEEINAAKFNTHLNQIITQCLADCDISDSKVQNRLVDVLMKCFVGIKRIKISDTLDVKQYVKVKKILGGSIEDSRSIDGLFITKNIDSKRMLSYIENPKIALLVFPIEYLKQKEQFISLKIVDSQQSVYISNLVSRLISLEPDLIVVGDTVCGLAERLLEEANITVLSNVKPQAIERISRYTNGDIFQSVNDLFLKKSSLGTCELFEVKRFLHKDTIKTYSFFRGSSAESGFTICLRGGDEEFLSGAKYTTETAIPGFLNARLEKSLLSDGSLVIQTKSKRRSKSRLLENQLSPEPVPDDLMTSSKETIERLGVCDYVELFEARCLSNSPSVSYDLPPVLMNVIDTFNDFVSFYNFNTSIQNITSDDNIESEWIDRLDFKFDLDSFSGKTEVIKIMKFVGEEITKRKFDEFSFRARLWSNCMRYSIYQLYPIFHKSIHFLHSTVSIKHATPCHGPAVVVIDYYTDNDKSLGQFMDQIFLESGKTCNECGERMLDHYKTYAHGNKKIDLIVERVENMNFEDLRRKNERMMWSHCTECDHSTPITAISDDTYFFSLGKFFELCFWSEDIVHQGYCPHDAFKTHVKYFGRNDLVIRMEPSEIDTYEVVVPKKKREYVSETDIKLKLDAISQIERSSSALFDSVAKRLNRVKVDTFDKAEDGAKKIEELKERLREQEILIKTKALKIHTLTHPTNYLSLNVIQRDIQELGVAWDSEFNDFEATYLPTENEITKITQFHLRNLLMDKLKDDTKTRQEESEEMENDTSGSEDKHKRNLLHRTSDFNEDEKGHSADATLPRLGHKLRVPLSLIEDKIIQIKQSFENDQNQGVKSPEKPSSGSTLGEINVNEVGNSNTGPNKVQDLTNYFNQMTLEFQRQREKKLEKNSNKYKVTPVANSKPIVEIYDNIQDVVDVDNYGYKRTTSRNRGTDDISESSKTIDAATVHDSQQKTKLGQTSLIPESASVRIEPSSSIDRKLNSEEVHKDEGTKSKLDIAQPEKNSLLKSLTNFWADRSATSWDPLEFPLDSTEHTFADNEVIVREDEPSSLVAFCLSSDDYKQKLNDLATCIDDQNDILEINDQYKKKLHNFIKIEKKFKKNIDVNENTSDLEAAMTKEKSTHLKFQFVDGNADLSCKIFYSEQFEAFRKACEVDDSFIQSLSRCVKWDSNGGKSGSNFLKTLDNRYILKELSKSELESFVSIAPFYFKYISQSTFNTLTTAIAKIFGFYQVEIKNTSNGKTFKMDFLIMENLFYNRNTTRIFDLKGSMRNRHVKQTGKENEVLLDENMIEFIYERPVFVKEQLKKLLRGSLLNDTSFLSAMDVMDYSLVIGIDDESHNLYVGIIDWLRTFTWDKRVENWVKGTSLVGKKGKDPTIITPKQYKTRFREAMDRYILEVPDIWYEGSTQ